MQRQSLGSPSVKIHGHGARVTASEPSAASPSPSETPMLVSAAGAVDDDDVKLAKAHRRRSSSSTPFLPAEPEKYIHLVPIITLLCFLVLFLCSHEPAPIDLAQFNGFKHPVKIEDSGEIEDFERVLDKGEILAIGSLRNLQEIREEGNTKSNSNRKLADF